MIIVNADDWGSSSKETDAALSCFEKGRITSVSAMVFMQDSERAADLAKDSGIDVGLHLNFNQQFTGVTGSALLQGSHDRIVRFLTSNKYSQLIYNPFLRKHFQYVYQAQFDEFIRLYGKKPTHIDGHRHQHLCANMLIDRIIPEGNKVRRNFSFWPGEKSMMNRTYRRLVDCWLARRYYLVDFFFALSHCLESNGLPRFAKLAEGSTVELMTHPVKENESSYLMSVEYLGILQMLKKGTYSLCE